MTQYLYVGGDSQNQDASPPARAVRGSHGFRDDGESRPRQRGLRDPAAADPRRRLPVQEIEYQPSEEELRTYVHNDTYELFLRRVVSPLFTGTVRYQKRSASWLGLLQRPALSGKLRPDVLDTQRLDNLPTLRQYYVSDYDRDSIKLIATSRPATRSRSSFTATGTRRTMKADLRRPERSGSR